MERIRLRALPAALAGAVLGLSQAAGAQTAEGQTVEGRVDAVEEKLRILERRQEIQQETAGERAKQADEKAKKTPVIKAGEKGFSIASPSGDYELQLRGYLQADGRFFVGDSTHLGTDNFILRRVRPILQGTIARYFNFKIMTDFGEGRAGELEDAYLDFQPYPAIGLMAGKFKVPVGLERLQGGDKLLFVERALPDNLIPNRDVGLAIHGEPWGGALIYSLGVFNGVEDGTLQDGDTNDDKDVAGRIFAKPFLNSGSAAFKGLGVGISGSYGNQSITGRLPSFKTDGRLTFFTYDAARTVPDGPHYRISPQGYWYIGPFGLFAEYVESSQALRLVNKTGSADNDAWQVNVSYVLTGEDAAYDGVVPARNFDPANGGWGAVQIAARYSGLNVDSDVFPSFANPAKQAREARAIGFGVNWFLNRNVKAVLNYETTSFDGGAAKGADRVDEHVVNGRLQIGF
jgi:phosphate-selective porin OprO/OprP